MNGEWFKPCRFIPEKRTPAPTDYEARSAPKTAWDVVEKGIYPALVIEPRIIQPAA